MAAEAYDALFTALADNNRRHMVDRLCRGPASVKELATPLRMRLPSALKHLRVLEDGGVVTSVKHGRVRTYRLDAHVLGRLEVWVNQRRSMWNAAFDQLGTFLEENPE